ncbi:MAG: hypothetical protein FVQ82_17410 [Planctomycetes bacterium]|nr:hypothetical protein [Planctomycetota bacterium]
MTDTRTNVNHGGTNELTATTLRRRRAGLCPRGGGVLTLTMRRDYIALHREKRLATAGRLLAV